MTDYPIIANIVGGQGGGQSDPYANTLVLLTIGDSNAGDTTSTTTYGPVTAAGVARKWNGSGLTDVATTDFSNRVGVYGTAWKKFALDVNAATGKNVVVINRAVGGSEVYPNGVDTGNWYPSPDGVLYDPAIADADACLAFLGKSAPDFIMTWVGVNDLNQGQTAANIVTGYTSLLSRLRLKYPTARLFPVSHSISGSLGMTATKATIKKYFRGEAQSNTITELFCNLDSFFQWGYDDGLHLTQDGYNKVGELLARTVVTAETNKEVRQVLTYAHNEYRSQDKAALKSFIEWCQANGCWVDTALDSLQIYVSAIAKNNVFQDLTNIQTPVDSGFDFVNNNVTTDLTPKYLRTNFFPPVCRVNSIHTDYIEGTKTGTNSTPAATNAAILGTTAGGLRRVFQSTLSDLRFNVNDATNTVYTGDTKFADSTRYAMRRSGTTKQLIKNSSVVQTATVAASAEQARDTYIGGTGGAGSYIACEFKYYYVLKASADYTGFEAQLETLIAVLGT